MTGRARKTAAETLRETVETERQRLAETEARQASASAELESLEQRAGAEVLDNPDAEQALVRSMQELRDRIFIAEKAAAAQGPRVVAAEAAYLEAEAAVLQRSVDQLQSTLDAHQARTAELLALLEEHEGRYMPELELLDAQRQPGAPLTYNLPRSAQLHRDVQAAALPVLVLREMAAGRDPQAHPDLQGRKPAEVYPAAVWGPNAVVHAPAWLRASERDAQQRAGLEQSLAEVEARARELEGIVERGEDVAGGIQDWTMATPLTAAVQLERAKRQLAELQERAVAEGLIEVNRTDDQVLTVGAAEER